MSYHVCDNCGHTSEIFSTGGGEKESQRLGVPLLGKLPLNQTIMRSAEVGEPLVLRDPEDAASKTFLDIAKQITALVTAK